MFRAEWKEIYLDQDAAQMIARLSTAIFMPALARNEEWLKIAVDYTVHFFTGAYVLRMIPPPLRPIVHWFLPFTRQLRLTVPYYFITPPAPATTKNLDINFYVNDTGSFLWTLGGESFRANYNNPVLLLADQGNFSYPAEWNVQNFGSNSSIRIIVNNPTPAAHPMHLHGHNMQILHEGSGNWDGTSLTNPNNPQRRDVQQVRAFGHMVMQFTADNPGVWPFHCHIAWHVSAGLYANILERPADIQSQDYQVPLIMQQTCRYWTTYSNNNVVDEIDSGL
jgi:FtsP/CotA-like multicopper oxidase with cupredoxin domain